VSHDGAVQPRGLSGEAPLLPRSETLSDWTVDYLAKPFMSCLMPFARL